MGLVLAVQYPQIQKRATDELLAKLDSLTDGRIEIGEILIQPFNALMLKDVRVIDEHPFIKDEPGWTPIDTVFSAEVITATVSLGNLVFTNGIHLGRVYVEGAQLNMVSEHDFKSNLSRIMNAKPAPEEPVEGGNVFDISKVRVKDFRFRLKDGAHPHLPNDCTHIDWQDLDLKAQLRGHNLRMAKGRVSGVVDALSAQEKCGYRIINATGRTKVGMGKTEVSNFCLIDEWSELRLNSYTMNYHNSYAFRKYISAVRMGLDIKKGSVLSMQTLHAFTGAFEDSKAVLLLDGGLADGYVNDLNVENLAFADIDNGIRGTVSCRLLGLPDMNVFSTDASIRDLQFTTSALDRGIRTWTGAKSPGVSKYARGRGASLNAEIKGSLHRLKVSARLGSRIGSVRTTLNVNNLINPAKGMDLRGTVSSSNLQLGTILGTDALGAVTMQSGLRAHLKKGETSVIVDSLKVSRLGALGYDYTNIAAAGRFSDNAFDGKVICDDPNLNFLFQGTFNLSRTTSNALYKFYANLGYADLNALNLYKLGEAKLSGQTYANFMRIGRGDLIGDVDIQNLVLSGEDGHKNIGDISIASHSNNDLHRIQFTSSFADGGYVGDRSFIELLEAIQDVTVRRNLPSLYSRKNRSESRIGAAELEFNFHDNWNLMSYFVPELYIADSTKVRLTIDRNGALKGRVSSPRVAYGSNYVKGLDLNLDNLYNSLNCSLAGKEIVLGPLGFKESTLTGYAEKDDFALAFHYDNISGEGNLGEIYMTGELSRDATDTLVVSAHPLYSYILFNEEKWDIAESSINIRAGEVSVDGFRITNQGQTLAVDGRISPHRTDTLAVVLENFDLSTVDYFLAKPLDLAGTASGGAFLYSPTSENLGMRVQLGANSVQLAGNRIGDLELNADWDAETEQYIIRLEDRLTDMQTLSADAYFGPTDRSLNATASLDNFRIDALQPVLSDMLSSLSGSIDGRFSVNGTLDDLNINGEDCYIRETSLTLVPTGGSYLIDGSFSINESGLVFENVAVRDNARGNGILSGGLDFSGNGQFLNALLEFSDLELMNSSEAGTLPIYGNVRGTGNLRATADSEELLLDLYVNSAASGQLHIPLSGFASSDNGRLLTFKASVEEVYIDPYEAMRQVSRKQKGKGLDFNFRAQVNATESIEAFMEIDKSTGNVMNVRGNGLLGIDVRSAENQFSINGDYNITDGRYHLSLLGIANKDFGIKEGSSIKFNGDIMDSDLDVDAVYNLKTSLTTLLNSTSAVSTLRPVECGIKISDKIVNPRIGFAISIPDLDPTTKSQVESALNTEDKVLRQFISLLIAGSFLPSESSGIVNSSNILYSNVTEIMSGQLNNILQKLNIPVDLDLGYHPNEEGADIFDVAVSTQLFNNRVVVNGTIGNRQYSTSTNPNGEMVGDMDIEIKLDKPGKFRLNLFSHSADEYTSYLDYSQRNGVGLTYQKEYSKFGRFLRELFMSRKKREDLAAEEAKKPEDLVIIDVNE